MGRAGLLAIAVVSLASIGTEPLPARRRELALVAGGNYSGATGGNLARSTSRLGYQAGVSLRMPRGARFSEFLLFQRRLLGERSPSSEPPLLAGPKSDDAKLLYAQVPFLLHFQRGYSTVQSVRPFLTFGPYVGVLLSCDRVIVEADDTSRQSDCSATPTNAGGSSTPFIPRCTRRWTSA